MAAYLIANLTITDPVRFEEYRRQVSKVIANAGGFYLIRGGEVTVLEGDPGLQRLVVVEFSDVEAVRSFYDSDEYRPLLALRQSAATGSVAIVDGFSKG